MIRLRDAILPLLHPYASRIAIFGSVARGEDTAGSDIDLLVKLRPPNLRPRLGFRFFEIEAELAEKLDRRVELVTESSLSPQLRPEVERDILILYEE